MFDNIRIQIIIVGILAISIASIMGCSILSNPVDQTPIAANPATNETEHLNTSSITVGASHYSIDIYNGDKRFDVDNVQIGSLQKAPVIINFWAAMCPPCRAEMPELQNFHNEYHHQVTIIGIDVGKQTGLGTKAEAIKLMQTLNVNYPVGSLVDPKAFKVFNVLTMPTTIFVDSNGDIFRRWTGAINYETLSVITNLMLSYEDK